jgi:DNA mismatch repair protein MutS
MTFQSILFEGADPRVPLESTDAPAFFEDLHLDQVVEAVTADWKEYNLAPFYYRPLYDPGAICYRQEVMRELEAPLLQEEVRAFSQRMRKMRERLEQAKKFEDYAYTSQRCFLEALDEYAVAVERFAHVLGALNSKARGWQALGDYFNAYVHSASFRGRAMRTRQLKSALANIRYNLLLHDGGITVQRRGSEEDYSAIIDQIFSKFKQAAAQDFWVELRKWSGMNHIEAQIQHRVMLLYPDTFGEVEVFCRERPEFLDATIVRFDREIQFYIAYLSFIGKLQRSGLSFCHAELSADTKEVFARETFDLALAAKLVTACASVVPNDFLLRDPERMFVVSGPNQGGKTTFARLFGQLHYLARLGCPVPGKEARLFLCDQLFTHFEQEEHLGNLRGKLQDDLLRIREILRKATPKSIVILNELFLSTTLKDALELSKAIMQQLSELDLIAVWVTFLEELSSFNAKTVSLVSQVDRADPARRTYKLQRKPADGLAFALALAEKHGVTYNAIRERLKV